MEKTQKQHEIIADLKRVSGLLGGATPNRDQYRAHGVGAFSERQIANHFGSFREALRAAGFGATSGVGEARTSRPSSSERALTRQLATRGGRDALEKRFEEEILPYVGRYERDHGQTFTLMLRTDDHAQWVDPFCDEVFWDIAQRIQPSVICFGGDQVDFYEISAHSKNPRRLMTLQSEIDYVERKLFQKAREVCPDAQLDWVLGNHEWRLFRYLSDVAPGLSSLRCLRFDDLFRLADHKINLIARPSFLNARRGPDLENYKVYQGKLAIGHGTRCGKHPSQAELEQYGMTGASGHVHRHGFSFRRTLFGYNFWVSNGAMCQIKSGEEYIADLINWTQGFSIFHIEQGNIYCEYVDLTSGFACVGGVYYRRKPTATPT